MKFTQEEVDVFCKAVGDTNPIHRPEIGIVPGLLVTSVISKDPKPGFVLADLKAKYVSPLYVGEEFELVVDEMRHKLGAHFIDCTIKTASKTVQVIRCTLVEYHKN